MRKKLWFLGLCLASCFAAAQGAITVVADSNYTFGGAATSQAISVSVTPAAGQIEYVAVQLGSTPAPTIGITPNPAGDVWTQATCSGVNGNSQFLFYHVVVGGDGTSLGTVAWSSAMGGTVHVSLRSGGNTSTPVGDCEATKIPASNATPSLAIATRYENSFIEADFENATLGLCGTGAGTCNQSGWTESGYTNSAVFGEAQYDQTQGLHFATAQINFTSSPATSTRILAWSEPASGTIVPWCYGFWAAMGVGC